MIIVIIIKKFSYNNNGLWSLALVGSLPRDGVSIKVLVVVQS